MISPTNMPPLSWLEQRKIVKAYHYELGRSVHQCLAQFCAQEYLTTANASWDKLVLSITPDGKMELDFLVKNSDRSLNHIPTFLEHPIS